MKSCEDYLPHCRVVQSMREDNFLVKAIDVKTFKRKQKVHMLLPLKRERHVDWWALGMKY